MQKLFYILCAVIFSSCLNNSNGFKHDPGVPYPLLNPGDSWIDKFDQRGLQNAIIYKDKIYCNTIDVGGNANFLYCLNPKNGLVVWRAPVEANATQPASFSDNEIIYSSFVGNISAFDYEGKNLWKAKFGHPYGGHWLDTANYRLLVRTVYWKNVSEYNVKTGELISDIESDSLQKLITSKIASDLHTVKHEYSFTRQNKTYIINGRPPQPEEGRDYIITISTRP